MGYVSYDRSSKIDLHQQITNASCAATCAGMCVKKSPTDLQNDGIPIDFVNFGVIGTTYGYPWSGYLSPQTLTRALNILSIGYPVIVKVRNGSNLDQHWVVITKYEGLDTAVTASNFKCADPATGSIVTLSSATMYTDIYQVC